MHILLSVILMITCVMCFFLEKYFMPSISVEGHVSDFSSLDGLGWRVSVRNDHVFGLLQGQWLSKAYAELWVGDGLVQAEYKAFPYYKISPSIGKRFMKYMCFSIVDLQVLLAFPGSWSADCSKLLWRSNIFYFNEWSRYWITTLILNIFYLYVCRYSLLHWRKI